MNAPEPVGVELTEAEIRTAYLAEYSHAKVRDRYDADLLMAGFADGARWLAARQAPTVHAVMGLSAKEDYSPELRCLCDEVPCATLEALAPTVALDVETVAAVILESRRRRWDAVHQGECITDARAVVAADPRQTVAEVKEEALREAREEAKYIRYIYGGNEPCKPLGVVDVLDVLLDQRAERIGGE